MRSWSRSRWVWGVSVSALVLGAVLLVGTGVPPAVAGGNHNPPPPPPPNPFAQILTKLDQILAAIGGIGGGGQDGNHTLRWDTNNPSASRFTTAFPGAVLDKNTGLVWEQAPDAVTTRTWSVATSYCVNKNVGGTVGWRLPSVVELKSVQDPSLPAPFVPASVFTGVQSSEVYWSASSLADVPTIAWFVNFGQSGFGQLDLVGISAKTVPARAWCVRGPMQESAY